MAAPAVTYTFTNNTTADATQVNQNFTDIINGITDGTKTLTIGALVVASGGATTLGGAVILGSSSSNDLTFNGSIASSIPVKTNATYSLGSATLGLLGIYLGGASTKTVRLLSPTVTNTWTLTLPIDVPSTAGRFLTSDTNGATSWLNVDSFVVSKTTTYVATTETSIPCDATLAGFTVTLPAAASNIGKKYFIIKTDSTTNAVTIDGNGAETINGALTTTLNTQYESVEIVCDGFNWFIVNRDYPRGFTAFTPTGSWVANTTYTGMYRRAGDAMHARVKVTCSGAPTSATLTVDIPFGLVINNATFTMLNSNSYNLGGSTIRRSASGATFLGATKFSSATKVQPMHASVVAADIDYNNVTNATSPITFATGDSVEFDFTVPIVGWN